MCKACNYKLKYPVSIGQYYRRGKIVDIVDAGDRHWLVKLQYLTVPDKTVLVYID